MDFGGDDAECRDKRFILDGNGTGFGSDIGSVFGRGGLAWDAAPAAVGDDDREL